jgi:rubrerythrin
MALVGTFKKLFVCTRCGGYVIVKAEAYPPPNCPKCGASSEYKEEVKEKITNEK